jgi:hypothetical protein
MSSTDDQRSPTFSDAELFELTGYHRAAEQLAELHRRGFARAYRNRLGRVVLERPHYDAVTRGEQVAAKPKVRLLRTA